MSRALLDESQAQAVEHRDGPLLVLAGPGSGKTRVVTHRIARLLERGVDPRSVLAVTFTNKAAREMRQRVRALVGRDARSLAVSTIHSACARILREEIEVLGYRRNFSIYDEGGQQSLLRLVLRDVRGPDGPVSPSAVAAGLERARSPAARPDGEDAFLREVEERYRHELRARNAVDFEDLIGLTARLFAEHPQVLQRWRERVHHVLVDEYQDTNAAQDEVITLLAAGRRNLCVVGDDDQSIYGWRGADSDRILRFAKRWPDAKVVRLERNYRSTGRIVALSAALIAANTDRHPKALATMLGPGEPVTLLELGDEEEEADHVASGIAAGLRGQPAKLTHGVLMRTNEQARPFEQALRRLRVPYRLLGGRSFFDRKEVQDVLAFARVAVNPEDEDAFHRIVNVPARGLGESALETLRAAASGAGVPTAEAVLRIAAGELLVPSLPARAAQGVGELAGALSRLRRGGEGVTRSLIDDLLSDVRYESEVERSYKDLNVRASRLAMAREVQRSWETYLADAERPSLAGFLDELALGRRDDERDDAAAVTLATVHAAKGLEFDVAHVVGLEDGLFPHARSCDDLRSLEEERRLLYVALTRARRRLVLTRALHRTSRGAARQTVPSRLLDGLPEGLLEREDAAAPASSDSVAAHVARVRSLLGRSAP